MTSANPESGKLFPLIKNLTKSEKRYFKLFCNKISPGKEKSYLKLFSQMEALEKYDEHKLIKTLNETGVNTTYFEADKNYLYNLILKTLRVFHSGKTSKLQILEQIEYTEILYLKGLYSQALKQLRKAKKIAVDYDILSLTPEILRLERKLKGQPIKLKELDKEYSEYQLAIKKLTNFHEFDFLYRKGNWIRRNEGKVRKFGQLTKYDQILNHELFTLEGPHSFYANIRYFQTKAAYYYSMNDSENEYKMNNTLIDLFDSRPKIKAENYLDYVTIFSRILILTKKINPKAYSSKLLHFKKLGQDAKPDQSNVKSMVASIFYSTELVRMINIGAFKEANDLIPEINEQLITYSKLISDAFKINFFYKFAYIKIGIDNYSQALDYVNIILNNFDEKHRPDIYSYTKILSTIIHFELENKNILPYISQSTYNHLRNRNKLFKTEGIILNFIKKIHKTPDVDQWNNSLYDLRDKLLKTFEDPKERQVLAYFDFISWLDSKIDNITFTEAKKINIEKNKNINTNNE